jgi:HK97 family phage prohead protease
MSEIEKRGGPLGVEVRAESDKRTLTGYAAVFNEEADIGGYWIERIEPGAFTKSLAGDVRALVDHDTARVIGRTRSGTLRLSEDERGLKVEIDVPNTTNGNDLWELVERGDVSGMSFGFRVTRQEWNESAEPPVRTIKEVELYEVSAVAFPAYDGTEIGKRSLEAVREEAERRAANRAAARRRLTERKARMDHKFRGI